MAAISSDISLHPEDLFEIGLPDQDTRWWVLYTRPRHEKALARAAVQRGISFFLPLIRQGKYSRGYRYTVDAPLFPGYFFLLGSDEQRVWSLTTNHVSRVLTVPDPVGLFADLGRIHQLLRTDAVVLPERRLVPGNRVRVIAGPLLGMEGQVLVRRGKSRLLVSVNFLQQGASVEIDDFMLEPLA